MTRALTEPMVGMHQSHEALNQLVKLGAAAFHVLLPAVSGARGGEALGDAINATGEPWQQNLRFRHPAAAVQTSLDDFARLCLVQGTAGFDLFTEELVAEVCRCDPTSHALPLFRHTHQPSLAAAPDCCSEHSAKCCRQRQMSMVRRVETLTAELGITDQRIVDLLPAFHYFRLIRNCIAHDGGLASSELSASAASASLATAWNQIAAGTRSRRLPNLLTFAPGQRIVIRPSHAVLGATVCHRLSNLLNENVVRRFGVDGLLHMTCYHVLTATHPDLPKDCHSPAALVCWLLHNRYKVKLPATEAVRRRLKSLRLDTHCRTRYGALYDAKGKRR